MRVQILGVNDNDAFCIIFLLLVVTINTWLKMERDLMPCLSSVSSKFLFSADSFDCVSADEESSRESDDGQEDVDVLRSTAGDREQSKSTLLSPSMRLAQRESSETACDGLKPAFWMTDYKQPKRCKKGSCAFQTVSKVSKSLFLRKSGYY